MRPGLTTALSIFMAAPLAADWAEPTCTAMDFSSQAPFSQGRSGKVRTGKAFSDWQWRDPVGVVHSFPGTSRSYIELEPIPGLGFIPQASTGIQPISQDLIDVQASDGSPVYLTTEGGGRGRVEVRHWIYPKFKILSVIYAPPGNGSVVSYGTGFGMGATTSISHTYSDALGLNLSAGIDAQEAGTSLHAGVGANGSTTTEDGRSITLANQHSGSRTWSSTADGIDHDQDLVDIWLNPGIELIFTSPTECTWRYLNNPADPTSEQAGMNIVQLTIAQLCGRSRITNEYLLKTLARPWSDDGGLTGPGTDTDFQTIAQQDPYYGLGKGFQANAFTPDPKRFTLARCDTINFSPATTTSQTTSYAARFDESKEDSTRQVQSYAVSTSMSIGIPIISLQAGSTLTWTDMSSRSSSRSTSATCDVQIRQPAQDWAGPTRVVVYTDERFGTFLFVYVK